MRPIVDFLLRSSPALTTGGALLAAAALGSIGRANDGAVALAAGISGALGDVAAHLIKLFVTEPLYTYLGRDSIPVLGRGPRPPGAERCGWWPWSTTTPAKTTYGMPSGHAAHAVAMFVFMELIPTPPASVWYGTVRAILGVLALAVPISRIALGCHTPGQSFWGAALGVAIGHACAQLLPRDLTAGDPHGPQKPSKVLLK
mgnify:CR=1 FL=1